MHKWISGLWMIKTIGLIPRFSMNKRIVNKNECLVFHFEMQINEQIVNKDECMSSILHFGIDKQIINKDEHMMNHGRLRTIIKVQFFSELSIKMNVFGPLFWHE
ncbi:hypothetical protein C1645_740471 [Glomus cerebriforme]|uniref:Uncharacterized protein n=1 Tax=Glomus cerebriforme TaxID=658196 RepID=A0A397SLE5_9GLOM|nr:hypothetical protein C1645_740471 [Glomus cerebriforme]